MSDYGGDLREFIAWLREAADFDFDVDEFDDRVKLQKYLYLAGDFGLDHPYDYNIYLHGPYSPALAEDYYSLDLEERESPPSPSIDVEGYTSLIQGKDKRWLEIAATISSVYDHHKIRFDDEEKLREVVVRKTCEIKEESESYVEEVYEECKPFLS
jgi:uncharacterized protein YwgA